MSLYVISIFIWLGSLPLFFVIKMKSSLQLCPGISFLQRTRTICQYATLIKINGIVYRKINLTIVKVVWLSRLHDQTHCVNNTVCTLLLEGTVCNTNNSGMSDQKTQNIDKIVLLLHLQVDFLPGTTVRKNWYEQIHWFYIACNKILKIKFMVLDK